MIILIEAQNKFLVLLHGPAQTYRKESKINKNNNMYYNLRSVMKLSLALIPPTCPEKNGTRGIPL